MLEAFAMAIDISPALLEAPPIICVNRSLSEAERYLALCFNAVLGDSSRQLIADPLCTQLPLQPSGVLRISRHDYEMFRERLRPLELEINCLLPPSQHYGAEEAIVIVENFDSTELPLEFSAAQINVLAQSLGGEILRLRRLGVR